MTTETIIRVPLGYSANDLAIDHPCGTEIPSNGVSGLQSKPATVDGIDGRDMSVVTISGVLVYYAEMSGYSRNHGLSTIYYGCRPSQPYIELDSFHNSNNSRYTFFVPDSFRVESLRVVQDDYSRSKIAKNLILYPKRVEGLRDFFKQGSNYPTIDKYNAMLSLYKEAGLTQHHSYRVMLEGRNELIDKYVYGHGFCVTVGYTKWHHIVQPDGSVLYGKDEFHRETDKKISASVKDFHEMILKESSYPSSSSAESERGRSLKRIQYLIETYASDRF
ncbi:hypothetical protein [Paenibacillus donghaensis]|uniref:Uncharacterized protein n=1 Tax=Paenibacillus donghaensis TaxID=414771 RepID=A0A2Z2KG06_9BACL|nr:hypothetical protein [Paenibacillus donghaensis]ASA22060.1 hypothetical protein B9T62_15525 [Paenibacillus donghaensis]